MSSCQRTLLALLLALPLTATPLGAVESAGGNDLGQARETMRGFYGELLECMQQGEQLGLEGRRAKLEPAVAEAYDLPLMAAKVLGRHWRSLSDDDKGRWVDTFRRLTVATYAERFGAWNGEALTIDDAEAGARGTIVVHTRIERVNAEAVPVHYRMKAREGRWRVIDVFLNGTVSELALRRSEYGSVIRKDGIAPLIERLEAKIAAGKASADVAADLD
ncbi:MAG: hypothetical protein CL910_04920 [Deltaproteobacteria bacterium]|nr:hypothetical protein [Deltaproteobacteria bacterium]